MKYKVGDRVKVREDLEIGNVYGGIIFLKNMARLCGKTATIEVFDKGAYWLKEDEYKYNYAEKMLEPVVTNWDKLKEVSTGKFAGIGFCNVISIMRKETNCIGRSCAECKEWLDQPYEESNEEVREILDEAEKKYLSAVIKPFRDKVLHIEKQLGGIGEYIAISLGYDGVSLPYYKRGTMYKGMELGRPYTLEELGI